MGTIPARILVVEDEPRLRSLLRLYLERDGHHVTEAGDGPAALAAFDAIGADLVVLDLMLPDAGRDRARVTARRWRRPRAHHIGEAIGCDRIGGLRAGADDYLPKPFNPHELTARVAAILRRSRAPAARQERRRFSAWPKADSSSTPGRVATPCRTGHRVA